VPRAIGRRAKTEIGAMMEIEAGPEIRAERDALANRADKVRRHHVQQESIALRTPVLE
jgi:hypothetical protein